MCLPSYFNDKTDCHTSVLVCAAECIYNVKFLVGQLFLSDLFNSLPSLLGCWMVVVLVFIRGPPYSVLGVLVYNDEFVFRRTSCIDASHNVNCSQFADLSFFITFQFWFGFFLK